MRVSTSSAPLRAYLEATIKVRPGEGRRTALLFVYLLLASAVFILGRTVRDTLFLSRFPIRFLPWMFVLYGLASAVTVVVYSRYADRVPRHSLIQASLAIGIATYLATWALVRAQQAWIYPVFYVWSEVAANLFIVQFWTFANDLFDARAAKRLFPAIGAARMLGVIVVGLGAGAVVKAIGTPQLLFVLVAGMAGIAVCATLLGRERRAESADRPVRMGRRRRGEARIASDPYVRALAGMILLIFVALTIGDYQFKRIARDTFQEDNLARFFSLFYAGTGIVSFVFQLVLTPRILARLGVGAGMLVMPTVFGAGSALLLLVARLPVATAMKFADNGFQYTIHETTLQALYVPFPPEIKARTRAFLDAVVKPLSYGAGGVALLLLVPHLSVGQLSFATVPLVLAWMATIPVVRRRYLRRLETTLSARGALALDHEALLDPAGRQALVKVLERGETRSVLLALEQLADTRTEQVRGAVVRLAGHREPVLRAAALDWLAGDTGNDRDVVVVALTDPEPDVRTSGAKAYAAIARDEAVEGLALLLSDPARDVRGAAIAGLLRYGGIEGGIVGGAELGRLLGAEQRKDREAAAAVLRELGPSAYRPLRRLLGDEDPGVRRAALKAASGVADPRLVPVLLDLVKDPASSKRAGAALVAVGEPAVEPLCAALDDPGTPRTARLAIPRMLRRIPRPETYRRLLEHAGTPDSHLRLRVLAALSHLRADIRSPGVPLGWVRKHVQREVVETYRNLLGWTAARERFPSTLLDEEFAFRRDRAIRRILRLLELRYDPEPLKLVRNRLDDSVRRANALEVLDTLLDPPLRSLVMPFVDEVPAAERTARAQALVGEVPEPLAFLREQCRHSNPYVALLGLDALRRHDPGAAAAEGTRLLDHPEPLVREGAALATGRPQPEGQMYSTLEKVLLLKRAPLFERIAGEDLAALARVADVERFASGEALFREGEVADAFFVIVNGRVAIARGGHQVAVLGAGEAVGEMAVLDRAPRSATATALEDTEVLWVASEEFYEILHEQVEIAEGVIRILTARLRAATEKLAGNA
jgi:ATP/ADP translocase/HEAT repeat protein